MQLVNGQRFLIDGIWWTLELVDESILGEDLGRCLGSHAKILILDSASPDIQLQTFFHELGHAFLSTRETSWEDSQKLTEEAVVRLLMPSVYSFLANNSTVHWSPHD